MPTCHNLGHTCSRGRRHRPSRGFQFIFNFEFIGCLIGDLGTTKAGDCLSHYTVERASKVAHAGCARLRSESKAKARARSGSSLAKSRARKALLLQLETYPSYTAIQDRQDLLCEEGGWTERKIFQVQESSVKNYTGARFRPWGRVSTLR